MFLKNSLKQLLRTPVKTALLALLLCLSVLFACVGATLLNVSSASLEQLNAQFTTIGTVEQIPNTVNLFPLWDAARQDYTYYNDPQYDELIPVSALPQDGVEYLYPPMQFPFYIAYHPSLSRQSELSLDSDYYLEARPLEDSLPDHPVRMEIVNVLFGPVGANKTFYFCDHRNDSPEMIFADTTYLMGLMEWPLAHEGYDKYYELVPVFGPVTTQCRKDGTPLPSEYTLSNGYTVVTEGFYNTSKGKSWLNLIDTFRKLPYMFPVIPTNATHLLMEFHQQTAQIIKGRDITEEEYAAGKRVCLADNQFLAQNNLKIGDTLSLPLVMADYRSSAIIDFGYGTTFGLINAEGEEYAPFFEAKYTIVGSYTSKSKFGSSYDLAPQAVIVPYRSIPEGLDENNIVAAGPMQGSTTVFEIPNGTIDQFMEAFSAAGVENLKVQFYDNGYSELKAGLDNLSAVAWVLFASGLAVFLAVAFFFAYSLIARNARCFALERALGASRRQCVFSAVSAFLLVGAVSAILGAAGSYWVSRGLFAAALGESAEMFDTSYSVWVNATDAVVVPEWLTASAVSPWPLVCGCLAAVLLLAAIAFAFAKKATSREPMALLQNE